jgi:hypothetical protein
MTMAADVRALWCALHDLRDAVLPVRMQAVEDRPGNIVPQPVQVVADGLDSVFGRLQQAIAELSRAIAADGEAEPRHRVVAALGRCNATLVELGREWTEQVSSYHRLAQLVTSARERGWRSWARSLVDGVQGCERARDQVQLSLLACWQGLAEQGGFPDLPRTPLPRRRSEDSGPHEQDDRGHGDERGGGAGDATGLGQRRPGDAAHHR